MKQRERTLTGEERQRTGHLLQLCWLLLFLVFAGAGCQKAKVSTDTNPAGAYTLVSVNGNNVPCGVQHEGRSMNVKSGTFTINPDGTCSSKVVFSVPPGGESSREVKAHYTQQGSTLTMKWEGAGTTTGTVKGDTFTMNNEGMIFAYRK